jgi:hypothetical protein
MISFFSFFFFFAVLVLELRAYLEPLHQPFFVMGVFKIGSHEPFARAGFELQSF